MRFAALPIALAAAAALAVAAEPAAAQVAGTYQLARVGGQALPAVIDQDDDCREELVSATLELRQDGTWMLETVDRDICGDDVDLDTDVEDGRYSTAGQTITFLNDDGEPEDQDARRGGEIDIDDPMTGTLGADGLTVRLDDGVTDLFFQR